MRSFICIQILLILSVVYSSPVSNRLLSQKTNAFDTCLADIKVAVLDVLSSSQNGFEKNPLDLVKFLLHAGGQSIVSYEDCQKFSKEEWFAWLDQHTNAGEHTAFRKVGTAIFDQVRGILDATQKKPEGVVLSDFSRFVTDLQNLLDYVWPVADNKELIKAISLIQKKEIKAIRKIK